jgi:hypothetical protein
VLRIGEAMRPPSVSRDTVYRMARPLADWTRDDSRSQGGQSVTALANGGIRSVDGHSGDKRASFSYPSCTAASG